MTPAIRPLRRRQNNNQKQTLTYMVLLVLIVIFLGTVGIQLVVKTSVFLAGFNKTSVKKTDDSGVLIEPEIDDLPDATNSAQIVIEGRSSENTIVEIYVNEDKEEEIEAPDGTFSSEVSLKSGENNIYIRSLDEKKKRSKDSQVYKVLYLDKKPELSVKSPTDGVEVDKEEIMVAGTATENAVVKVNGLPTIVNASGEFSRVVQLKEGENIITVQATDLAGSSIEKQVKVVFRKD